MNMMMRLIHEFDVYNDIDDEFYTNYNDFDDFDDEF